MTHENRINQKLEAVKDFQIKYPTSHVGGSVGLFIRGIDVKRSLNNSDLDITIDENMKDKIIECVKILKECTMQDVATYLGVSVHKVSGRFGELVKMGVLKIDRSIKVGRYNYAVYKLIEK